MYKKIYNGGSYGPGMTFNGDRLLFKNCTFIAQCTFGDHCDFVNCTFVKCCPKPFTNQSSTGKHCRFFNCKLESVKVGSHAELYKTNKSGYLVVIQSAMSNENKTDKRGPETDNESTSPEACGQRFDSVEFYTGKKFNDCCGNITGGYSDVKISVSTKR